MHFHMKFNIPMDLRQLDLYMTECSRILKDADPWTRMKVIQMDLLDKHKIRMLATLSPAIGEEGRDGGLQGLWGRN